jgi:hypothetical protein
LINAEFGDFLYSSLIGACSFFNLAGFMCFPYSVFVYVTGVFHLSFFQSGNDE